MSSESIVLASLSRLSYSIDVFPQIPLKVLASLNTPLNKAVAKVKISYITYYNTFSLTVNFGLDDVNYYFDKNII